MPFTRKIKKAILTAFRQHGWPNGPRAKQYPSAIDSRINQRAAFQTRMAAVQQRGYVAIVRSGMDCDCTQYYRVSHIPVPLSLFAFQHNEDQHCEWLDGPESMFIGHPSEHPVEHRSSDRALAAYEDGNPSHITHASYDEMQARV